MPESIIHRNPKIQPVKKRKGEIPWEYRCTKRRPRPRTAGQVEKVEAEEKKLRSKV